jgi:hypothetical protein
MMNLQVSTCDRVSGTHTLGVPILRGQGPEPTVLVALVRAGSV